MASVSPDIILKETDARFWAQSGLPAGRKIDPNNPTDKAFIPVWNHIHDQVVAEANAGKLVTTFDHPGVAQDLSDAAVAHQASAMHADLAAAAPDAATRQQQIGLAATASQISSQKSREAASKQPPTVNPDLVKEASKEVAKNPPPPQAPSSEHIAHEQARHAPAHAQEVHAQAARASAGAPSRDALYHETDLRFSRLGYKPGQKLDMSIPRDREMADVWRAILQQVQREAQEGTLVFTSPDQLLPPPAPVPVAPPVIPPIPSAPPIGPATAPPIQPYPQPYPPGMQPYPPAGPRPMQPFPPGMQPYPPGMQRPPMGPVPPMGPPMVPPRGQRDYHGRHDHEAGPARGAPGGAPGPAGAPGTLPAAPAGEPGGPPAGAPGGEVAAPAPPPEEESHVGTYLMIGLGAVVVGGITYYMVKHRSPSKAPRTKTRTPKVFVATPTASSSARLSPSCEFHSLPVPAPRAGRV